VACVTIVGTGLLGTGIAEVLMRGGHGVILHDFALSALTVAHKKLETLGRKIGASVKTEPSLELAVEAADFVLEAVSENLALKQSLFQRMGAANRHAILMSNSSVLPIGEIASKVIDRSRTVGTHWWNPPQLIPIVEIVRGPHTSEDVMKRTMRFHAELLKTPIRVNRDVPGFIGNRIQHALWREALAIVSEGKWQPQTIDVIASSTLGSIFAEIGPWEQMRRTGWRHVEHEFASTLPVINSDATPARTLRENVARGRLGAKSGQGFLQWRPESREQTARRLNDHVAARLKEIKVNAQSDPLPPHQEPEIARRLRVAVWREAIALVDKQVCTPADVDHVVCNTIGLRLEAMGPIENADYVGLDLTLAIHEAVFPSLDSSIEVPTLLRTKANEQEIAV